MLLRGSFDAFGDSARQSWERQELGVARALVCLVSYVSQGKSIHRSMDFWREIVFFAHDLGSLSLSMLGLRSILGENSFELNSLDRLVQEIVHARFLSLL